MATPPEYHTLVQKLEQLGIDIGLLGRFVQGGDAETVLLGGAATPTLRKLARDIDARESAAARDVIDRGMADIADKSAAVQALVDTAQSIVDAVKRISATAETVEPDRPAAADYTPATGRILFSIPRGAGRQAGTGRASGASSGGGRDLLRRGRETPDHRHCLRLCRLIQNNGGIMPTYQIQFRGDTTANWTAENPVLLAYEMGIEVTADGRLLWKIGDGATPWLGLGYASGPVGPSPDYEWTGTSLRFKSNDGAWGEWVNLVGPSVAYRWDGTALQLQNPDGTWGAAVDLRGPEGPSGTSKPATPASLGGVIPGAGLHIDGAGRLDSSLAWSDGGNYPYPVLVQGGNGAIYLWKQPSGPGVAGSDGRAVGARDPLRDDGTYWAALLPDKYDLCEFYYFRHPDLKPGFFPAMGGLLENAPAQCPRAWEYLQTVEGQKLCKTEEEWQAMTTATWATLADGSTVGWNGIGGAPWYVVDTANGTLRLPDLRGMYIEAAGFDSLGVGGVHGWGMPKISGQYYGRLGIYPTASGPFLADQVGEDNQASGSGKSGHLSFDTSRVVPTANKFQPRAWGALACVYLGQPAS